MAAIKAFTEGAPLREGRVTFEIASLIALVTSMKFWPRLPSATSRSAKRPSRWCDELLADRMTAHGHDRVFRDTAAS